MVSYHLLMRALTHRDESPFLLFRGAVSSAICGLVPHESYAKRARELEVRMPPLSSLSSRVEQLLSADCNPLIDLVDCCGTEQQFAQRWNAINVKLKLGVTTLVGHDDLPPGRTSRTGEDTDLRRHVMTTFIGHLQPAAAGSRRSGGIARKSLREVASESSHGIHADLVDFLSQSPASDLPSCVTALGGSKRTVQRHINEAGVTFVDIRQAVRIELSKRLLFETARPMTDIALGAGFYDSPHFCHAFRKSCGLSPGEYRVLARVD